MGGRQLVLGHNGNLTNTAQLAEEAGMLPGTVTSDSDLLVELIGHELERLGDEVSHDDVEQAVLRVLPRLEGAFSLVIADEERLIAVRDPHGFRPLCLGKLEDGWVLASESPALDIAGATFVRDLDPGEVVVIDSVGPPRSVRPWPESAIDPKLCVFEFFYFARPDSRLYGNSVHAARVRMGELLAEQAPAQADMVMGVPESGIAAAEGFARASGIPYGQGLVKNRYVGRSFIAPTPELRRQAVKLKLNPLRENIAGKRLVVVDDSIVRGTTQQQLTRMLREAGRGRDPPADHQPAGAVAVLLRHRHRRALRAARRPARRHRGDPQLHRGRHAALPQPRRPHRLHRRRRPRLLPRLLLGRLPRRGARRPRQGRAREPRPCAGRRPRAAGPHARGGLSPMGESYRGAGVDIDAGERAVDGIKALVRSTFRPEVIGDIGGFGALFSFPNHRYQHPVLVSSTDGVGTKALIAQAVGRFDTIGVDLVAMCVDDIVCQGAEPLFFLDYIAVGKLDPQHIEQLVTGIAEGCRTAGCALIGGEMAEHPGAMEPGEFDLVGFTVGVAERDRMISGEHVAPGDVLIGLPSPGLRSNGYQPRPPGAPRAGRAAPRRPRLRGRPPQPRRRAAHAVGHLRPRRSSPRWPPST